MRFTHTQRKKVLKFIQTLSVNVIRINLSSLFLGARIGLLRLVEVFFLSKFFQTFAFIVIVLVRDLYTESN